MHEDGQEAGAIAFALATLPFLLALTPLLRSKLTRRLARAIAQLCHRTHDVRPMVCVRDAEWLLPQIVVAQAAQQHHAIHRSVCKCRAIEPRH